MRVVAAYPSGWRRGHNEHRNGKVIGAFCPSKPAVHVGAEVMWQHPLSGSCFLCLWLGGETGRGLCESYGAYSCDTTYLQLPAHTQELQIAYFVALGKIPFWEFILENHLSRCVKECVQIPPKLLSETKQIPLMEYVHGLIS